MTDLSKFTIKDHVSTLDNVQRSDDKKTLGSALSQVSSSHAAVFIYNEFNEFQGLVSPYKAIYSSNYPHTTHVSSILFVPPKIDETTKVYDVAKHMVATKVYMLPVFSGEEMKGVVYSKDLMVEVIKNKESLTFIKDNVQTHSPITAPVTSLVNEVFNELKEKGVSRIVLVDDKGVLAGIVTRGDLMESVMKPTEKVRVANEGTRAGRNSFGGEKKSRKEEPVRKFYSAGVFTLPDSTPIEQVVARLVESLHNSVVLVNKQNVPTGFLSTRDVLQAIALMRPKELVPIQIKKPSKAVEVAELERSENYLEIFAAKLEKRVDIQRIEVTTEEPKNQVGDTHAFNTNILVVLRKGDPIVAHTKNRIYFDGIQEAAQIIEKQLRRSK